MENTVLEQVLAGKQDNYILPFFWQHGEEADVLRKYMHVIHDANIGAVCVEARPHPDFAGEKWWQDLDVIVEEAKKLDMKVWILDDAHFPSGQAAGKMEEAPDALQKQFVNYHLVDICGPVKSVTVDVARMAKFYKDPFAKPDMFAVMDDREPRIFEDDALFAVIASRLDGKEGDPAHLDDTLLDLTAQVKDGTLVWDIPAGFWRIFVLYTTRNGGGRSNYINFMSKQSCRVQIDAVYEPHYARYKEEFGKTIAGFFSDEPEIGNVPGYGSDNLIGKPDMPIPWSEEMPALMEARFGKEYARRLLALWFSVGSEEFTAETRVGFMDIVSRQAQKNFGEQMGDWCREHGVEYIGHIIEDEGTSTRLGAGQGHFFRALRGQDWAGVDTIGGQIVLGGENVLHRNIIGADADGAFYHHQLSKLGVSLADIDPRKKGRTMCEAFGAYGWNEGTRLMKYIADHLLVRGVNRYVPHAFSPKEFPDFDCPPHFYAHGKNPLYQPFGTLMQYVNRISHLISGGQHAVEVAVLYTAEQEWSGQPFQSMNAVARVLDEAQIDFSFVPNDVFTEKEYFKTRLEADGLHINDHVYKAFVIPGGTYLPKETKQFAEEAAGSGVCVYYLRPEAEEPHMCCIKTDALVAALRAQGIADVLTDVPFASLQAFRYEQAAETIYLLSNESAGETFAGKVKLSVPGKAYAYDAMDNELYGVEQTAEGISLVIRPYEMVILVLPKEETREGITLAERLAAMPLQTAFGPKEEQLLGEVGDFTVSFTSNEAYPRFTDAMEMQTPENVLLHKPHFSGIIRYEATCSVEELPEVLALEDAYESVEAWCNGRYLGQRICPPYRFAFKDAIKSGENTLRLEVRTTLDRQVFAMTGGTTIFGPTFDAVVPEGIVGKVQLLK